MEDAAASAPRNIAEGFGRFNHADFARFVRITRASEAEVLNHFLDAIDRGHLQTSEFPRYELAARRALKASSGLIKYLESTPTPRRTADEPDAPEKPNLPPPKSSDTPS